MCLDAFLYFYRNHAYCLGEATRDDHHVNSKEMMQRAKVRFSVKYETRRLEGGMDASVIWNLEPGDGGRLYAPPDIP